MNISPLGNNKLPMRFDFSPFFNPGENIPWNRVIKMMREQTQLAEDAGFTTVWCSEHHFAHNGIMNAPPNPIQLCTDLAAHSKKIRVGQCPVVLPDWHPLRVAEDVALLDNMTEGRVDFGAGRGVNDRTCIQFNIEADKRDNEKSYQLFRECLEIIIKAWTEDPFSYKGDYYEFPVPGWHETNRMFLPHDSRYHKEDGEYVGMYIHPRPFQKPYPPTWLMSNAPITYDHAGTQGMKVIGMASPPDKIQGCWDAYRESASLAQNRQVGLGEGVAICVAIYVAESMEEAARDIRPAINKFYQYLDGARPAGEWNRLSYLSEGETLTSADQEADWFDFLLAHDLIWIGDAEFVAEKIEYFQQAVNMQHIMLIEPFFGLPYEKILKSMTLFAENVMSRFPVQVAAER